jgi:hypothetical protein
VPLLDHFHPPLSERRPWESFHATLATTLADVLNRGLLPPGYIALEQVHRGAAVEIDVGTFTDSGQAPAGGTTTATRTLWLPDTAPVVLPAQFPPAFTVEILSTEGGRTLVAAIELVSPGTKDRAAKRRLFAAKCATYLSRGIGLIVVDLVTNRRGNLHDEIIDLLSLDAAFHIPVGSSLYAVAYRPLSAADDGRVEAWPVPLAVGERLPTLPLCLDAEHSVPADLEAAYVEACQRRRFDEVLLPG